MFVMFKHDVDVLRNHHVNVPVEILDQAELSRDPSERAMARRDNVYAAARIAEHNFLELVDETPVDARWFRETIGIGNRSVRWGDILIEFLQDDPSGGIDKPLVMVSIVIFDADSGADIEHDVKALFTRGEALQFCNIIMGKKMVK